LTVNKKEGKREFAFFLYKKIPLLAQGKIYEKVAGRRKQIIKETSPRGKY
jgi:hypothetical protein